MKFDLKKPCGNCPFIKGTSMVLRPGRMLGIVRALRNDYTVFPCHKTTRFDEDENGDTSTVPHAKEQACMGALAYTLEHMGRIPVLARIAIASGDLTIERIESNFERNTPPGEWRTD